MLNNDAVTLWRETKEGYKRIQIINLYAEETYEQSEAVTAGPRNSSSLKFFIFTRESVELDDYVVRGLDPSPEPPARALRVVHINPYRRCNDFHHVEVLAR